MGRVDVVGRSSGLRINYLSLRFEIFEARVFSGWLHLLARQRALTDLTLFTHHRQNAGRALLAY